VPGGVDGAVLLHRQLPGRESAGRNLEEISGEADVIAAAEQLIHDAEEQAPTA
jgi:hypothetical protein